MLPNGLGVELHPASGLPALHAAPSFRAVFPAVGRLTVGRGGAVAVEVGVGQVVTRDDAGQYPQALDALPLLLWGEPSIPTHDASLEPSLAVPAAPHRGVRQGRGGVYFRLDSECMCYRVIVYQYSVQTGKGEMAVMPYVS